MSLTKVSYSMITGAPANVMDFGAVGDGVTNDAPAIALAFAAHNKIIFPPGTYLMNSGVTKSSDNVEVDFGNANILNGGATFLFTFGITADTPQNTGLKLRGGQWEQVTPLTTSNYNYILIKAVKDFVVRDMYMKNVSNGGLSVWAGAEDGVIDNITIPSKSGNATLRGIWLDGSGASDYSNTFVNTSTIARNTTPLPVYGVKNVIIKNCTITAELFSIYCMNAHDVKIVNNHLDTGASGMRCLALNPYCPNAFVSGNTFIASSGGTGILASQVSTGGIIEGNIFRGTFGSGRDIYVAYLSDVSILNNTFLTETTRNVLIDMGASAIVKNNTSKKPTYVAESQFVELTTIDPVDLSFGGTATSLAGSVIEGNYLSKRLAALVVRQLTSTTGSNVPGLNPLTFRNNIVHDWQLRTGTERMAEVVSASSANTITLSYYDNDVFPLSDDATFNVPTNTNGFAICRTMRGGAADSKLFVNAAGEALEWSTGVKVGQNTRDSSLATGTQAVTGTGFKPSSVLFFSSFADSDNAGWGLDDGSNRKLVQMVGNFSGFRSSAGASISATIDNSNFQLGSIQSFDSNGFTISWVKTGLPTGTVTFSWIAFR